MSFGFPGVIRESAKEPLRPTGSTLGTLVGQTGCDTRAERAMVDAYQAHDQPLIVYGVCVPMGPPETHV